MKDVLIALAFLALFILIFNLAAEAAPAPQPDEPSGMMMDGPQHLGEAGLFHTDQGHLILCMMNDPDQMLCFQLVNPGICKNETVGGGMPTYRCAPLKQQEPGYDPQREGTTQQQRPEFRL